MKTGSTLNRGDVIRPLNGTPDKDVEPEPEKSKDHDKDIA